MFTGLSLETPWLRGIRILCTYLYITLVNPSATFSENNNIPNIYIHILYITLLACSVIAYNIYYTILYITIICALIGIYKILSSYYYCYNALTPHPVPFDVYIMYNIMDILLLLYKTTIRGISSLRHRQGKYHRRRCRRRCK